MSLIGKLDALFHEVGPWSYVVLGASAWIEYLIPIFPGDTITLLGGVYAARGERPWALVLFATTLGSVLGALCDYAIGRKLGRRVESKKGFRFIKGPSAEQLASLEAKMRRRGNLLLLCNRFLPGIRPLLFVAAGASQMPLGRVMALGAVSALLWNGAIIGLGMALGGNVEKVAALVNSYQQLVWVCLLIIALALVVRFLSKRRLEKSRLES